MELIDYTLKGTFSRIVEFAGAYVIILPVRKSSLEVHSPESATALLLAHSFPCNNKLSAATILSRKDLKFDL